MKRKSRREDSEREENPPAERFSKITPFEPGLRAAGEKLVRMPALMALSGHICNAICVNLGGTANNLRPYFWDEGFIFFREES